MFLLILSISIFILVILGLHFFYIQPKNRLEKFAQIAKKTGYKVKVIPYQFMSFCWLKYVQQDQRSLQVFKQQLKNYDLIVGNMFTQLALLPTHPQILKDLFNQSNKLHKNKFYAQIFQELKKGGIAFAEGEQWRRKRRIISQAFHYDFLNDMIPTIQQEIELQLGQIQKRIKKSNTINLFHSFSKILSSIVVRCFFGTSINSYKINEKSYCEAYVELLDELTVYAESFEHMFFGMLIYRLGLSQKGRKLKEKIDLMSSIAREVTQKQIEKIKNKEQTHQNILTILYHKNLLCQKNQANPSKYTIDQLIGQFYAFLAAGTDTTSNTVNLLLHYLSLYPHYTEKINQELDQIEKIEGLSKKQKLKEMKWIEAVFNQTLRINGPAAQLIPRIAIENMVAGGLEIHKGTFLTIYPILSQYKEQNFQNPFKFSPQRWIEEKLPKPYTFIPFSAGQRNCIGQHLARIESKILVQKILKKFKFRAKQPIRMKSKFIYRTLGQQFQLESKQ